MNKTKHQPLIVTVTPNPSIDTTFQLSELFVPGNVQRVSTTLHSAGGKGMNVSHALHKAAIANLAIFPAHAHDHFLQLARKTGISFVNTPATNSVRINTTICEPDGTTTKLNGAGAELTAEDQKSLESAILQHSPLAQWVALAGSLPPGLTADWYCEITQLLRNYAPNVKIAIDTADAPLRAVYDRLDQCAPDLLSPNSLELGQLVGIPGEILENEVENGNFLPLLAACDKLLHKGLPEVLVTLGAAGAVLINSETALYARCSPVKVLSTVGAGDSTLAGYLRGIVEGYSASEALQLAVGYGTAAVTLPGTAIPGPVHAASYPVTVEEIRY
ncbi:1-phosphofructokinase family hexose kinase [Corynebacterium sp. HS2168-gen11]|uniref:1-phosphofructokinase family hexose kinase n=1 Tax=Corynebacterium sp. HS2168-gen11 TaxID=2974027 RepID=UPI00216B41B6|nr:1-phosphofructokinase family hexose kinase [Corynebacterium sp. HS2168-gen11]MCS4535249.1 1-phosphofructokinase family hexose kinase [Corynebacterium sp. HS2168-gen11]